MRYSEKDTVHDPTLSPLTVGVMRSSVDVLD